MTGISKAGAGRGGLFTLARLGLAVALLAFVLSRVEWTAVAAYRHTLSWPWLAGFVGLIAFGHLVSSAKWRLLLAATGHHVGLWRLTGLYLAGQFYNAVFPSTIGGDIVRSLGLRRIIGDTRAAFASTVAERFTGAAVLVVIGAIATLLALPHLMSTRDGIIDGRLAALLTLIAIVGTTVAMAAVLSTRTLAGLRVLLGAVTAVRPWLDKLDRFQGALRAYRRKKTVLARAIGYSVLFHATVIGTIYAGCRMIGDPGAGVGVLDAAVITPIILLIALLPLTPGGYGVVQWGYMVTFAAWELGDVSDAATLGVFVSLMLTACNVGLSAIGYAVHTLSSSFDADDRESTSGQTTPAAVVDAEGSAHI
ncbi:MAG: flippase-like domain-containing protein [Gemmatimonadetes bacterium]|nr:flippase-like domain-containing protein [Gemmatimonadota bacterium]